MPYIWGRLRIFCEGIAHAFGMPTKERAMIKSLTDTTNYALSMRQRSHLLLVLSNPKPDSEEDFAAWFPSWSEAFCSGFSSVLSIAHYRQHEVDITAGRHAPVPFSHLTLCELSLDECEPANALLRHVSQVHADSGCAAVPATWLYFPLGDRVGRPTADAPMLTIAFANPIPGMDASFREFYATRHIRHALHIPALVSGQCFERAQFQAPGAAQPVFQALALYEQTDEPDAVAQAFVSLPPGTLDFPMLDKTRGRFWECSWRRVGEAERNGAARNRSVEA